MHKVVKNIDAFIEQISNGSTLAIGGFGLCGIPEKFLVELSKQNVRDLTCISNNAGVDGFGIGLLLENRQVRKIYASYVGENKLFEELCISGELEVELVPQGTLAERLRAGGAGIPAFYTATGVGTVIAEGKEERTFHGRQYILEEAFQADFGIVKAWKADTAGNLIYRKTAQNFNPLCAACGKVTLAEVEEIVPEGELDPDHIHTPSIYVDYVYQPQDAHEKRIERKMVRS
jgi:3-oxoacid CoA-transferase subunit A